MKKMLIIKNGLHTLSAFALPIFVAITLALFNYWYQHQVGQNQVYAAGVKQIEIPNGVPRIDNKCYDYRVRAVDEAGNYSPWTTMQENNTSGSVFQDVSGTVADKETRGNLTRYLRLSPMKAKTIPRTTPLNPTSN